MDILELFLIKRLSSTARGKPAPRTAVSVGTVFLSLVIKKTAHRARITDLQGSRMTHGDLFSRVGSLISIVYM